MFDFLNISTLSLCVHVQIIFYKKNWELRIHVNIYFRNTQKIRSAYSFPWQRWWRHLARLSRRFTRSARNSFHLSENVTRSPSRPSRLYLNIIRIGNSREHPDHGTIAAFKYAARGKIAARALISTDRGWPLTPARRLLAVYRVSLAGGTLIVRKSASSLDFSSTERTDRVVDRVADRVDGSSRRTGISIWRDR